MHITEMKINALVKEDIRLSSFFQEEKIDFCCNGHRVLSEVLSEKNLDPKEFTLRLETFQKALDEKGQKDDFFNHMDNEELIHYIVSTHHSFTRSVLRELDVYTSAILRAHYREDRELLLAVNDLYGSLRKELLEHLVKEEADLFPLILEGRFEEAKKEIEITEDEHDAAGNLLAKLRQVTKDYTLPSYACSTFEACYHHLEALESDLFRHIFLENSILFERF